MVLNRVSVADRLEGNWAAMVGALCCLLAAPSLRAEESPAPKLVRTVTFPNELISVAFHPTKKIAVSGSDDGEIELRDCPTLKRTEVLPGGGRVVSFLAKGAAVLAVEDLKTSVSVIDLATKKVIHTAKTWRALANPDGGVVVYRGNFDDAGKLFAFSVEGKKRTTVYEAPFPLYHDPLHITAGGLIIAREERLGEAVPVKTEFNVLLVETPGKGKTSTLTLPEGPWSAAVSPCGKNLLIGCSGGKVFLFRGLPWRKPTAAFSHGVEWSVDQVAFSPDGKVAYSKCFHRMQACEVATGRKLAHWTPHKSRIASFTFDPDGRVVTLGLMEKGVKFWELPGKWKPKGP